MPGTAGPRLGLVWGYSPHETGWGVGGFNPNFARLEALVSMAVISFTATPPSSPANGDIYIVATGGTGIWSGHDNSVAVYYTSGGWIYIPPGIGLRAFNRADNKYYRWGGSSWITEGFATADVTGPSSATDGDVVVFNGTTGKIIKDSGKVLPSGVIVGNSDVQLLTNKTIDGAANTLTVHLDTDVAGNLAVSHLNGGSGASSTTAWFGDGTWKPIPATGAHVTISDTPPSSPAVGDLWFDSGDTITLYVWMDDGSSTQWIPACNCGSSGGSGGTSGVMSMVGGMGIDVSSPTGDVTVSMEYCPLTIAYGGTGAEDAPTALVNLGAAPINSPALVGTPTAPTASPGTNTGQIATCAFVLAQYASAGDISGVIAGTGLTGGGTAGDVTISLATPVAVSLGGTGGVNQASACAGIGAVPLAGATMTGALVLSGDPITALGATTKQYVDARVGTADWANITNKPSTFPPTLPIAQSGVTNLVSDLAAKAPLASPVFTGTPQAPVPVLGDSSTTIPTTSWVQQEIDLMGPPAGSQVTGNWRFSSTTTAPPGSGQIRMSLAQPPTVAAAITAWLSNTDNDGLTYNWTSYVPKSGDTLIIRSESNGARVDIAVTGSSDGGGYRIVTGTVAAVSGGTIGNNNVCRTSFTRPAPDLSVYAPLASPTFTGNPTAPTPSPGDADTSIATTGFVDAGFLKLSGGTINGTLTIDGDLTATLGNIRITGTDAVRLSLIDTDNTNVAVWNSSGILYFGPADSGGFPSGQYANFNSSGKFTISGGSSSDLLEVVVPSGQYGRVRTTVSGTRTWSFGTQPDGVFQIADETIAAGRLVITTGGACTASSTWGVISDIELKTSIEPWDRGFDEILKLEPIRFRWKQDDGTEHYGLSAQQVEAVLPELIREVEQDGRMLKSYSPTDLVFVLIRAVKKLAAEVAELKGQRA